MRQAGTSEDNRCRLYRRCQDRYPTIRIGARDVPDAGGADLTAAHESHSQGLYGSGDSSLFTACARLPRSVPATPPRGSFLALACAGDGIAWELFCLRNISPDQAFALNAAGATTAREDLAQDIVTLLLGGNARAGSRFTRENEHTRMAARRWAGLLEGQTSDLQRARLRCRMASSAGGARCRRPASAARRRKSLC